MPRLWSWVQFKVNIQILSLSLRWTMIIQICKKLQFFFQNGKRYFKVNDVGMIMIIFTNEYDNLTIVGVTV